jgi:hypothetical protein
MKILDGVLCAKNLVENLFIIDDNKFARQRSSNLLMRAIL